MAVTGISSVPRLVMIIAFTIISLKQQLAHFMSMNHLNKQFNPTRKSWKENFTIQQNTIFKEIFGSQNRIEVAKELHCASNDCQNDRAFQFLPKRTFGSNPLQLFAQLKHSSKNPNEQILKAHPNDQKNSLFNAYHVQKETSRKKQYQLHKSVTANSANDTASHINYPKENSTDSQLNHLLTEMKLIVDRLQKQ